MELHDVSDVVRIGVSIAYNREPVTGESPKTIIQRRSDSLFFDGSTFVVVRNELAMTEADSNNTPGYYFYDFDQSMDGSEEEYLVRLTNTGTHKFVVDEWHRFTKARADTDEIQSVKERTDNLPDDPAGLIDIQQELSQTEVNIRGGGDTLDSLSDQIDSIPTANDWTNDEKKQVRDALGIDGAKTESVGGAMQKLKKLLEAIIGMVN